MDFCIFATKEAILAVFSTFSRPMRTSSSFFLPFSCSGLSDSILLPAFVDFSLSASFGTVFGGGCIAGGFAL